MWTWLKDGMFSIIQWMFTFCGDWGMAIILVTIIFRAILYPITSRQNKASYNMQKMQPKIKEIQARYANDQKRMGEEMQKIYAEEHFNPLSGCLPMLLMMPIFLILYQALQGHLEAEMTFYNLIPNLAWSLQTMWSYGVVVSIPYIILVVLFSISTFIPMIMQGNAEKTTLIMGAVMAVMMLWIGWAAPAGVMLFWITSSFIGIAQQMLIQKIMKDKDRKKLEEAGSVAPIIEATPADVHVERRTRKPKPTKKH